MVLGWAQILHLSLVTIAWGREKTRAVLCASDHPLAATAAPQSHSFWWWGEFSSHLSPPTPTLCDEVRLHHYCNILSRHTAGFILRYILIPKRNILSNEFNVKNPFHILLDKRRVAAFSFTEIVSHLCQWPRQKTHTIMSLVACQKSGNRTAAVFRYLCNCKYTFIAFGKNMSVLKKIGSRALW